MAHSAKLWIVVADGGQARVVIPRPEDFTLETHDHMTSESAHLRSSDLGADRPGRVHESASATRHSAEPRTDPAEAAKQHFAQKLGRWVADASRRGEFDELVLVATSHILSKLKDSLDKPAADKLRGALAKDLTKVPDHELQPHLSQWVRPPHRIR